MRWLRITGRNGYQRHLNPAHVVVLHQQSRETGCELQSGHCEWVQERLSALLEAGHLPWPVFTRSGGGSVAVNPDHVEHVRTTERGETRLQCTSRFELVQESRDVVVEALG